MKFDSVDKTLQYGDDIYAEVQLSGLFDDFKSFVGGLTTQARDLGIKTPLDNEIQMLRTQRDNIKGLRLRAESQLSNTVARIYAQNTIQARNVADQIKSQADKAIAKSTITVQYYARAILKAQELLAAISRAAPSAKLAAEYAIEKQLAVNEGRNNEIMFNNFFAATNKAWQDLVAIKPTAADYAGAVAESVQEAGIKAAAAGKVAAPYIPWLVAGAALLYFGPVLKTLLPRGVR